MAVPMETNRMEPKTASRRALLAAAFGGVAAIAARAVVQPAPVRAAGDDGTPIEIGATYADAQSQTTLGNNSNDQLVLWVASNDDGLGNNSGHGTAITGFSAHGTAIEGWSNGGYAIHGHGTSIGVFGVTSASNSYGVLGYNNGSGYATAIRGWTGATNGTGVEGFVGSFTGTTRGVWGYTASNAGTGVSGEASAGSGATFGVKGVSSSTEGIGAAGHATQASGVFGYSGPGPFPPAKPKTGVFGYCDLGATSKGLWGQSPAGRAVQGNSSTGYAGYFDGKVYTSKFHEMSEVTNPTAPGSNKGRIFMRDNGSGKTQLCVRFHTGAIQVLATQP